MYVDVAKTDCCKLLERINARKKVDDNKLAAT